MSVLFSGQSAPTPPNAATWRDSMGTVWTDQGNGRWRSHHGQVLQPREVIARYGAVDPPYHPPHRLRRFTTRLARLLDQP